MLFQNFLSSVEHKIRISITISHLLGWKKCSITDLYQIYILFKLLNILLKSMCGVGLGWQY